MAKQQNFEIITHLPETKEEMAELRKRIAIIQAQAIIRKINKLPIPTEQKLQLVDAIMDHERELNHIPKPKCPKRTEP